MAEDDEREKPGELSGLEAVKRLEVTGDAHLVNAELMPGDMVFMTPDGREILKLCANGDIHVRGRLAETDRDVVEGMRALVLGYKLATE